MSPKHSSRPWSRSNWSDGGLGSGVIYDSNGRILTAAHVVTGVDTVLVRFANGDRVPGRVIGSDDANDIAVVEVDMTGLPAAPLALDEDPVPASWRSRSVLPGVSIRR
jgi:S1-C subfamily serine protease